MTEKRYKVFVNNEVVAENMDLNTATILVKALFEEYYNDYLMEITVKQMDKEKLDEDIYPFKECGVV